MEPTIFPFIMLIPTSLAFVLFVIMIHFNTTTLGQIGLLPRRAYENLDKGKVDHEIGILPNPVSESQLCSLELSPYDFAGYCLTLLLIVLSNFEPKPLLWIRLGTLIVCLLISMGKLFHQHSITNGVDTSGICNGFCDITSGFYSLVMIYTEIDYCTTNQWKPYSPNSTMLVAATSTLMIMKCLAVMILLTQRMKPDWSNGIVSKCVAKYAEFLRSHSLTSHIRNLPYDTTAEDIYGFIWNKLKRTDLDENFQLGVPLQDLNVGNDDGDHGHDNDDDNDDDNGNDQGNDNGSSNNEGPGNRRSLLGGYNEDDGPVNDAPPVNDNGDNEINPGGSLANEGHGRGRVHSGLFDGSVGLSNQLNTEAADLENGKHRHGQKLHKRVTRRSKAIANEAKQASSSLTGVIGQNGGFNPDSSGGSAVDPDLKIKTS